MLGFITLIIAIVVQVGYTIYCLLSKSRQTKVLFIIRIAALGILSLLLLIKVYEWGFRWILLFIVLSILAISSVFRLSLKFKEKPFKKGKAIFKEIAGILLFTIAVSPGIIFPQYKLPPPTGEYDVTTTKYTYIDPNRLETYSNTVENREVNVEFWYPENVQGKFPLIVFSHGLCGIKNSNESTFINLASHGYVVCSIDHPYQSFYTVDDKGKLTIVSMSYLQEYSSLDNDKEANLKLFQKWMNIWVKDISFTIDTILDVFQKNVFIDENLFLGRLLLRDFYREF